MDKKFLTSIPALLLLSACMMLSVFSVLAGETTEYPYADIEALKKEKVSDTENNKNLVSPKNMSSSTNQKKRSIKMIVGGNSENGLAKEVTLPIDE